jgi:hypothetical protein
MMKRSNFIKLALGAAAIITAFSTLAGCITGVVRPKSSEL